MNLIIDNQEKQFTDDFMKYLIYNIQRYMINRLDEKYVEIYTEYLNSNKFLLPHLKKLFAKDILISGIYNLKFMKLNDKYIIYIDNNQYISDSNIKIDSLCKFINFGNLLISGYPIFTKTFKYFKFNLVRYFNNYLYGY